MPSSVIQAMRYDPIRHELLILFRGGRGTYRYAHVAAEEWLAFLEADSKGAYLNEVFKPRRHPYTRLMEPLRAEPPSLFHADEARPHAAASWNGPLEWGEISRLPHPTVRRARPEDAHPAAEAAHAAEKLRA